MAAEPRTSIPGPSDTPSAPARPDWADWLGAPDEWARTHETLARLAHRFLWNRHDAEDVVHDAVLEARAAHQQLRDAAHGEAWLRKIVVRRALLALRHRRSRERTIFGARDRPTVEPRSPAQCAAEKEDVMRLRNAIERLPEQQQIAVTLRHLEGLAYTEIAETMEIAESTVRFHVREARLALARMLGEV